MSKLANHLRAYKRDCILAPLFKLLEALLELLVPLVVAAIVDKGIATGNVSYIITHVLLMLLLAILGLSVSITSQFFSARAASSFARDVKQSLFDHIQSLSTSDRDKIGSSTLITRMSSDMTQVQAGVNMALRLLLRSPFIVFGATIMAFTVDVKAALIFAVVLPLLILIVWVLMAISLPRYRSVQRNLDSITASVRENLSGVRVIRAFNLEEKEKGKFSAINKLMLRTQLLSAKVSVLTNPLTSVVINGGIIALLYTGAIRVDSGSLTQGEVIALVNYMSQILVELIKLANLIITITRALASAKRVEAIFAIEPSMKDGTLTSFSSSEEAICFENVTFSYNEAASPALQDISFRVKKGSTLGIIGGTGSGKSTLSSLILREYDASSGSIKIFSNDIKDYSLSFLHKHISAALQKARLFSGTIRSNLLFANNEASDKDIEEALKASQAWEFVEKKGLDSAVEALGLNFSGGQRQRLSVARALISKPDILILDDSSSALDYATDRKLREALAKIDATKVIISQRAASLMHADNILVLDNGRLISQGTHSELLSSSPLYREIFYSQFKKEEIK